MWYKIFAATPNNEEMKALFKVKIIVLRRLFETLLQETR